MPRKRRQKRNYTPITVKICPYCGIKFLAIPKNGPRIFCCVLHAKRFHSEAVMVEREGTQPRKCLQCGQVFPSVGPGNRRCASCREGDKDKFRTYSEAALIGGRSVI